MKQVRRQRVRIARVRKIQHDLAAAKASRAQGEVRSLEMSAEQLRRIRNGIGADQGTTSGAALAGLGELALRLDDAREGLGKSLVNARAVAGTREDERLAAYRDQESADRLKERAAQAEARIAVKRMVQRGRRRSMLSEYGDKS
jgi:hypothetical protein